MLSHISIKQVEKHLKNRLSTHEFLCDLLEKNKIEEFVNIAIGIDENITNGNYSASEHNLGEKIIGNNTNVYNRIFSFAQSIYQSQQKINIPKTIRSLGLSYLKISVGSEIATMLKPDTYWIANIRTLWTQAYLNNNFRINDANEYIKIFLTQPNSDDIRDDYPMWLSLYPSLETSLREIARIGDQSAQKNLSTNAIFLWADAICSELYEQRDSQ